MRTVAAPDRSEHTVRIEWIGNKLRRVPGELTGRVRRMAGATKKLDPESGLDGAWALDLDAVVIAVLVVVVLVILVLVVLPFAWGLLELLLILVLGALVWAFRVLFRRPWSIVHRRDDEVITTWRVVGWREAHRVMVEAADSIERTGGPQVAPPPAGWA